MTRDQFVGVVHFLSQHDGEFHHGDCIEADAAAAAAAWWLLRCQVISHPPTDETKRAFAKSHLVHPPLPYLDRNRVIVSVTKMLLATPGTMVDQRRSGTWYTIRQARAQSRAILILFPDGTRQFEGGSI